MRRIVACAASCLVLAACGEPSGSGESTPSTTPRPVRTFTVAGYVTAEGSFGVACKGVGPSADLHRGTRVVVRGRAGASLATGALGDGFADDDQPQRRCMYPFSVRKVPEGRGPYSVQVARREPVSFDRRQAGQVDVRLEAKE